MLRDVNNDVKKANLFNSHKRVDYYWTYAVSLTSDRCNNLNY